jgi:hypothetical protein
MHLEKYWLAMNQVFHVKDEAYLHATIQLQQWHHAKENWQKSWECGSRIVDALRSVAMELQRETLLQ